MDKNPRPGKPTLERLSDMTTHETCCSTQARLPPPHAIRWPSGQGCLQAAPDTYRTLFQPQNPRRTGGARPPNNLHTAVATSNPGGLARVPQLLPLPTDPRACQTACSLEASLPRQHLPC